MAAGKDVMIRRYDDPMYDPLAREYYGYSDFYNFGCWLEGTRDQKQACENLVEKLLAMVPTKDGLVLDVACGMGANARHLLNYYRPGQVVGINVSRKQLETSIHNASGCGFVLMDAVRMGFRDEVFDNVICVEAAFHFRTREDFLREVYRLLKPGGRLALSDILVPRWASRRNQRLPRANWVEDIEAYREAYVRVGFQDVHVIDATNESWKGFFRQMRRFAWQKLQAREIGPFRYCKMVLHLTVANLALTHYVLVSARKPSALSAA